MVLQWSPGRPSPLLRDVLPPLEPRWKDEVYHRCRWPHLSRGVFVCRADHCNASGTLDFHTGSVDSRSPFNVISGHAVVRCQRFEVQDWVSDSESHPDSTPITNRERGRPCSRKGRKRKGRNAWGRVSDSAPEDEQHNGSNEDEDEGEKEEEEERELQGDNIEE